MAAPVAADPMNLLLMSGIAGAKPAGPAISGTSGGYANTVDNSGWMINFGAGTQEAARAQTPLPTGASTGELGPYLPYILLGLGGLVVWRMFKRSR